MDRHTLEDNNDQVGEREANYDGRGDEQDNTKLLYGENSSVEDQDGHFVKPSGKHKENLKDIENLEEVCSRVKR